MLNWEIFAFSSIKFWLLFQSLIGLGPGPWLGLACFIYAKMWLLDLKKQNEDEGIYGES